MILLEPSCGRKHASVFLSCLVFFLESGGMGKGTEETLCYPGMLKDSSMVTGCLRDPRAVFMSSVRSRASLTEGPWQIPFFLAERLLSPNWGTLCGTTDCRERR